MSDTWVGFSFKTALLHTVWIFYCLCVLLLRRNVKPSLLLASAGRGSSSLRTPTPFLSTVASLKIQGTLYELLLLDSMHLLNTRRSGSTRSPANIRRSHTIAMRFGEHSVDAVADEAPGTSIIRLLLSPDYTLGIGICLKVRACLFPGEGMQLLDARDGNVAESQCLPLLGEGIVDLARAQNYPVNLARISNAGPMGGIGNDFLEF